jgi:hypothetical protein
VVVCERRRNETAATNVSLRSARGAINCAGTDTHPVQCVLFSHYLQSALRQNRDHIMKNGSSIVRKGAARGPVTTKDLITGNDFSNTAINGTLT